jgi:hypothetical protein
MMIKNSTPPANVTILSVFVLFMTSWNAIRVYGTLTNWQVLNEFGAKPVYLLIDGIFWILGGLWLFRTFWEGNRRAIHYGLAAAFMYFIRYWIDRIFFQTAPAPNVVFSLVISTVLLVTFCIILVLPTSKAFFNKE